MEIPFCFHQIVHAKGHQGSCSRSGSYLKAQQNITINKTMDLCTVWNTNDFSEKIWKSIKRNCVWLLKRGVDLTIRRNYEDLSCKKCT